MDAEGRWWPVAATAVAFGLELARADADAAEGILGRLEAFWHLVKGRRGSPGAAVAGSDGRGVPGWPFGPAYRPTPPPGPPPAKVCDGGRAWSAALGRSRPAGRRPLDAAPVGRAAAKGRGEDGR